MKKLSLALPFLLAVIPAAAQNQVRARVTAAPPVVQENQNSTSRSRTVVPNRDAGDSQAVGTPKPMWGDSAVSPKSVPFVAKPAQSTAVDGQKNSAVQPRLVKPTSLTIDNPAAPANVRSAHAAGPTSIYRVG
ncbi:MAG TPA: hypothetical protein VIF81_09090, partial [Pyrinomonadaceae bacterium]